MCVRSVLLLIIGVSVKLGDFSELNGGGAEEPWPEMLLPLMMCQRLRVHPQNATEILPFLAVNESRKKAEKIIFIAAAAARCRVLAKQVIYSIEGPHCASTLLRTLAKSQRCVNKPQEKSEKNAKQSR